MSGADTHRTDRKLVIFTRFPVAGTTKTRLIPALGDVGAAEFQRAMTEYTLRQARGAGCDVEIRYTGGTEPQMRAWLGDGVSYADQGEGDLGERMARAFREHFDAGVPRVVVVGCDCPSNTGADMRGAFDVLESCDCVIGPACDGGYYLLGLQPESVASGDAVVWEQLFRGIDWGTGAVLQQTLDASSGLGVRMLPMRSDVDRPEDIPPRISVIIPTLNEASQIEETLARVALGFSVEVVVVDGGSSDGTCEQVAHSLLCAGGRAAQMNLGAREAHGELLLFLHADTHLPPGWEWVVRQALADPTVAVGAFRFGLRGEQRGLRAVERGANWRSRVLRLPYGDQALFMSRERFLGLGGFPVMPIMEDYALVCRARREGRIVTVPEVALTSSRRWREHGVLKVTWVNMMMVLGYAMGVSSSRLAAHYKQAKRK
jgi:rSAM/selenodomain-associated transferase 2/rSAM/selenodomain-associated transferase 1